MALKVKRQDNLDSLFGKFAQMDPKDAKRDKFLKREDSHKNDKRPKQLIKADQDKLNKENQAD